MGRVKPGCGRIGKARFKRGIGRIDGYLLFWSGREESTRATDRNVPTSARVRSHGQEAVARGRRLTWQFVRRRGSNWPVGERIASVQTSDEPKRFLVASRARVDKRDWSHDHRA